ncbi:MAG: ROK family protein [Erysipelotrichales bacterium]|nr:ROK family protein [Erysipelotrichales bacterium]
MKKYIGVDMGGTNVRAALVLENGEIIKINKIKTEAQNGPDSVIERVISLIKDTKGEDTIEGIGIGFPGPIDTINNVPMMSTNIPGLDHYPIGKKLEEAFGVPVYLDNDANVAGLAEALVGSGKGLPSIFYVTISTGIGGVLVVDGKCVSGKHGYAGEIANIIIDRNREKINHLNIGAVENEASGTAVTRKGQAVFGDEIKHAGNVFDLALQGNEKAVEIVDNMAYDLAVMFSVISHICEPHAFVLGGGVMASKDVFLGKVIENFNNLVHEPMRDVDFLEAKLEEPGLVGAAMLPISRAK